VKDAYDDRMRRVHATLLHSARIISDAVQGDYTLDDRTLGDIALELSRASNECRVAVEAADYETRPKFGGAS
jgi:hypothetical protein